MLAIFKPDPVFFMGNKILIWIFAGEASGDFYGAKLAKELFALKGDSVKIAGMGSHEMRKAGVEIMVDSSELGIVGLFEILKHIVTFVKIFLRLRSRAFSERPDVIVLIDYPGFNLRFAHEMYSHRLPVVWYISPQVWVWGKRRIPTLAKLCRKMLVIFPFEKEVYAKTRLDVEFVGHPLIDIMNENKPGVIRDPDRFLLLPGSRKDEIRRLLPVMLETVLLMEKTKPGLKYTISTPRESIKAMVEGIVEDFRSRNGDGLPEMEIACGDTRRWLYEAATGLAASGTVTVECAIAGLPVVVIYRVNPMTFYLGKMVIRKLFRGFMTMVNIIACKEVYKEYLQHLSPSELKDEIIKILPAGSRRQEIEKDMLSVVEMLSAGGGGASRKAADAVLSTIKK